MSLALETNNVAPQGERAVELSTDAGDARSAEEWSFVF